MNDKIPKNGFIISGRVWPPGDNTVALDNQPRMWTEVYDDSSSLTRYKNECHQLEQLALQQLNIEKNSIKPDFETLSLNDIVDKIKEELQEVIDELETLDSYERTYNEIGDVAACLVGLMAKLNKMKGQI